MARIRLQHPSILSNSPLESRVTSWADAVAAAVGVNGGEETLQGDGNRALIYAAHLKMNRM